MMPKVRWRWTVTGMPMGSVRVKEMKMGKGRLKERGMHLVIAMLTAMLSLRGKATVKKMPKARGKLTERGMPMGKASERLKLMGKAMLKEKLKAKGLRPLLGLGKRLMLKPTK
jgi:hypothetical protein